MVEILNHYFASVFTKEKDMENSEISVEGNNLFGQLRSRRRAANAVPFLGREVG